MPAPTAAATGALSSPLSAWAPELGEERLAEDPALAAWAQFLVASATATEEEGSAKSGPLVVSDKERQALGAMTNTCRSALTRAVGLSCTDALPLLTSFGQSAARLAHAARVLQHTNQPISASEWQVAQKWLRHVNLSSAGAWDLAAVAQRTSALALRCSHHNRHGADPSALPRDALTAQQQLQEACEPILAPEQVAGVHRDLNAVFQALGFFTHRGSGAGQKSNDSHGGRPGVTSPVAHYLRTGRFDAPNLPVAQRQCLVACLALGRYPSHHQLKAAGFLNGNNGGLSVLRLAKAFPDTPIDTLVRIRRELR